jgi:exosortase/archaeosortase family protein
MTKPIPGVDYWPDQSEWYRQTNANQDNQNPHSSAGSLLKQALVFILLFILMQSGWQMVRDEAIGHFIRGTVTVKPTVMMIHVLTPAVSASAVGNQIVAPGGGLVIKIGCEGLEALFILIAALLSLGIAWRTKLLNILLGTGLIYIVNEIRILILFYAFRSDKALFQLLHGSIAPLALIGIAGLFYHYCLIKNQTQSSHSST